jgi:hypothetical protein
MEERRRRLKYQGVFDSVKKGRYQKDNIDQTEDV